MDFSSKTGSSRRNLLKGIAAVAGAVGSGAPSYAKAQNDPKSILARVTPLPNPAGEVGPPREGPATGGAKPGSDFMLDVIKSLGVEYVAATPGSTFQGLHESIINYGKNSMPEFITTLHEEASVAMAHGYAKVEGKPMMALVHGTVGLQHASMALYNAYCDRVPVYLMAGNIVDATKRGNEVNWTHSVQDACVMVRDYIKWDDLPASLQHYSESAVRAYKIAVTPPMGPTVIVLDTELQEAPIEERAKLSIPKLPASSPPQGDQAALAELAKMLVAAENPVLLADRAVRSQAGLENMVELAELLQVAVVDLNARLNFPTRHPLNQSNRSREPIAQADLVVGLEVASLYNAVHGTNHGESFAATKKDAKIVSITSSDLFSKSNFQDFQRFEAVDMAIAADAQASLPALIEAVKRELTGDRRNFMQARGRKLGEAHDAALARARLDASYGWDGSPISTARLCMEIWEILRSEDWSVGSTTTNYVSAWPQRLWDMKKYYNYTANSGAYGMGYSNPAALGAALANKKHGRITVSIQPDGDFMISPGTLWTAAHHRIPILYVMHNNRAYHQEVMQIQQVAARRDRGIDRAWIGTTLRDPFIDYATLAKSMGLFAEGPITEPGDLGPALRRALAAVKKGEPALVDVVTQGR